MWFKKAVRGMNPWLPIFAVNILFQFQRHAPVDGVIFGVSALLMILDWKNLLPIHFGPRPVFRLRWIILSITLCATVLYLSPRHSVQDMWVLLAVVPIAVIAVYYRDEAEIEIDHSVMNRTIGLFAGLGMFMAIAELAAYVISDRIHNSEDFPTISFLVSPTLEFGWVRFLFLIIWMALGVGLMQILRGHKAIAAIDHKAQVAEAELDGAAAIDDAAAIDEEVKR